MNLSGGHGPLKIGHRGAAAHAPHPSALLTSQWLDAVRSAGLKVIIWHKERPAEIAALKLLGVDGICSDRPELLA